MAEQTKGDSLLRSWKEIAAHLGVDERTCARWEKNFGLPVHRAQGEGKKSRVFAYRNELDGWFQATFRNHQKAVSATPQYLRRGKRWLWFLPILAAAIIGAWIFIPANKNIPADFRIEGSVLVILNKAGQALGSYDTHVPNLCTDKEYKNFGTGARIPDKDSGTIYVLFRDLQRDGRKEVLFATQTRNELFEGDLICLNDRGEFLWKFHAGSARRYGSKVYSSDYRISWLDTIDIDPDGRLGIMLSSIHNPEWPCQLTLLGSDGSIRGEYWNSGHITDFASLDIDSDGRKEIVASGLNNEFRKVCVVALDTPEFRGSSPNSGEFLSADFPTGQEIAYILLPRTNIDQMEGLYEGIECVRLLANGNFQVKTHISQLFFEFRPDLTLLHVMSSHAFELLHRKYYEAGKVKTPYTEEEFIKPLEKQVLYFDGQGWTTTPTTKLKPAR